MNNSRRGFFQKLVAAIVGLSAAGQLRAAEEAKAKEYPDLFKRKSIPLNYSSHRITGSYPTGNYNSYCYSGICNISG